MRNDALDSDRTEIGVIQLQGDATQLQVDAVDFLPIPYQGRSAATGR